MGISLNLHCKEKWDHIDASLFGEKEGACIYISLSDKDGPNSIAFHFGSMKYSNEFISMLKKTINELPEYCETCKRIK